MLYLLSYQYAGEQDSAWDMLMSMDDRIKIASAEREHAIDELTQQHARQSDSIWAHFFPL